MTSAAVFDLGDLERTGSAVHVPLARSREHQVPVDQNRNLRLRALVDTHIDFVARVLRSAGAPLAEIDDGIQGTFIVAARRLDEIRPNAEKSFLFRIAWNLAAHARRTAFRRREVAAELAPEQMAPCATPEALIHQKRMRELLDRIPDQLAEPLRATLILYEIEELTTAEIAEVLQIPQGTVASRLRRARAEFRKRVTSLQEFAGYVDREGRRARDSIETIALAEDECARARASGGRC